MNHSGNVSRRTFLKGTSAGLGWGIATAAHPASGSTNRKTDRLPREVWAATMSMQGLEGRTSQDLLQRVTKRMEEMTACQPDVICLPEVFSYLRVTEKPSLSEQAEPVPGRITERFGDFAKKHNCYIICPYHTRYDDRIYNSAVVIDRGGNVAGQYHKIHPTTSEISAGVTPGPVDPPVIVTDFGTIGIQICFDVNWPDGWRVLRKSGAEIIFWPSAFPGGRMLNAMAWMNKAYVVTSTWNDPTRIIDITGEELAATGRYDHWICVPINLDKALLHTWPYTKQIEDMRQKYGRKIRITRLHDEGWTVVESASPNVSVPALLREFDIPTHEEHILKGHRKQEETRPRS